MYIRFCKTESTLCTFHLTTSPRKTLIVKKSCQLPRKARVERAHLALWPLAVGLLRAGVVDVLLLTDEAAELALELVDELERAGL